MLKQPKAKGGKEKAVVLERQYGPYQAKVCFTVKECSKVPQNVLEAIMQAYRCRIEKDTR